MESIIVVDVVVELSCGGGELASSGARVRRLLYHWQCGVGVIEKEVHTHCRMLRHPPLSHGGLPGHVDGALNVHT